MQAYSSYPHHLFYSYTKWKNVSEIIVLQLPFSTKMNDVILMNFLFGYDETHVYSNN